MEEPPKPSPSSSKLAYVPGAEPIKRIDPWWGLVVLVVGLYGTTSTPIALRT